MEPTRAHGDTHALIPPAPTRSRSTSPAPWPISVDHWRPLGAQQLQATRPAAAPAPYAAPRPAVPRAPLLAASRRARLCFPASQLTPCLETAAASLSAASFLHPCLPPLRRHALCSARAGFVGLRG